MIIRKKNIPNKKSSSSNSSKTTIKGSVIKKEDVILNTENIKNTNEGKNIPLKNTVENKPEAKADNFDEFEKIDISMIEFKERVERRRGDRRRGYRRIDERSLISRAQQEAHTIKELAAREGYQNGLKRAQEEIDTLKDALREFLSAKETMYDDFYPHIMEISLEVAKKIIKKETSMSNEILRETIRSVMDEVNTDAQKITIKVNPSDCEFAALSLPEILNEKNLNVRIATMPDDTVEKGSCVIIADNGVIDANFRTQLSVLQSAFGIYKGGL